MKAAVTGVRGGGDALFEHHRAERVGARPGRACRQQCCSISNGRPAACPSDPEEARAKTLPPPVAATTQGKAVITHKEMQ